MCQLSEQLIEALLQIFFEFIKSLSNVKPDISKCRVYAFNSVCERVSPRIDFSFVFFQRSSFCFDGIRSILLRLPEIIVSSHKLVNRNAIFICHQLVILSRNSGELDLRLKPCLLALIHVQRCKFFLKPLLQVTDAFEIFVALFDCCLFGFGQRLCLILSILATFGKLLKRLPSALVLCSCIGGINGMFAQRCSILHDLVAALIPLTFKLVQLISKHTRSRRRIFCVFCPAIQTSRCLLGNIKWNCTKHATKRRCPIRNLPCY